MEGSEGEEFLRVLRVPRTPIVDEMSGMGTRLWGTFIAEGALTNLVEPTLGVSSDHLTTDAYSSPLPVAQYKLVVTPYLPEEKNKLCFGCIGQGRSICLNIDCKTAHRGSKLEVKSGEAFVLKSKGAGFFTPRITTDSINPVTIQVWLREPTSLSEWTEVLRLAE